MAEEQRCQEGHRMCRNNCGFFGSPATLDLCSTCYRDRHLKEDNTTPSSSSVVAVDKSLSSSTPWKRDSTASSDIWSSSLTPTTVFGGAKEEEMTTTPASRTDRCAGCRKKVGLTGFKCKCGAMYCGTHRYPESHACTYDFKKAGREEIARANPIVKATKLERI